MLLSIFIIQFFYSLECLDDQFNNITEITFFSDKRRHGFIVEINYKSCSTVPTFYQFHFFFFFRIPKHKLIFLLLLRVITYERVFVYLSPKYITAHSLIYEPNTETLTLFEILQPKYIFYNVIIII